jgi:hypothetical protein
MTYHIYLNGQCLFKNLNENEFEVIWGRIYHSYFGEQISYTCTEDDRVEEMEASY